MKKAAKWGLIFNSLFCFCVITGCTSSDIATKTKNSTVIIDGCGVAGSGVLIGYSTNGYYILTAKHNFSENDGSNCWVIDSQRKILASNLDKIRKLPDIDLAIAFFYLSDQSIRSKIAKIGDSYKVKTNDIIYVVGTPGLSELQKLQGEEGRKRETYVILGQLIGVSDSIIKEGYQFTYSAPTQDGMSGGGLFDNNGDLVGIHALGDFTRPNEGAATAKFGKGIPISFFLESELADFAGTLSIDSASLSIGNSIAITSTLILGVIIGGIFFKILSKKHKSSTLINLFLSLVVVIYIVLICRIWGFETRYVKDNSMNPNITRNDWLLVWKLNNNYNKDDVVIFQNDISPQDENISIARIAGISQSNDYFYTLKNVNESKKYSSNPVSRNKILGRIIFRFYPFDRVGFIK